MIIDFSKRNWQAECIYQLFIHYDKDIEFVLKKDNRCLEINNFENCRERGYIFKLRNKNYSKEISFAECRNSDQIVIYPFDWSGINKEKNYKNKSVYLNHQEFQEAFNYILKYLEIEL